ncbi:SDR family NAD(P)-dependent oxidoreductase [Marivivens marinus]|uniref:SDR family NAD(P)-dependent oxidoreductase n=1 Tax=Marivivens marinus TaxID=3110173 RepID=UPI003B846623
MMELPATPSFRLTGKRALVVGASSGIGLACATALAEAGADVTLAARRVEALTDLAGAFAARGWASSVLPLDLADVTSVQGALAAAEPFDVVLNAAGLARHGPALDTTPEDFDAAMGINLRGAYFLFQSAARRLIDRGKPGSLISISSQMGHVGGQDRAVYCASKHGVEGMTKAMAIEWGPHQIRVNTICPTFILTDLTRPTFDDPAKRAWIESKIKLGRVGKVEDIMGAAVYLASDASAMVTGSAMMIDGGWTAD